MPDHTIPTPAGFADELARMVVAAYARRMGEHTGAAAELDAVREALGCDEGETTVDAVRRLLSEVDAADRATNVALEGAAGLRKQVADLKRDLKRDGLTDDEWRRVHKALKVDNKPDAPPECNLHSWSDKGPWSACCYTPDHAQAQCMWDKPSELTNYPGNGYEISAAGYDSAQAALAGQEA